MDIATSYNTSADTGDALKHAYAGLEKKLGGAPTWMAVHSTFQHKGETIINTLKELAPDVPFQGGSSCMGVMTEEGFHSADGLSLGLLGIRDEAGSYGVGFAHAGSNSRAMGRAAIREAMQAARKTTPPALVWITCAPGDEEQVLEGVEEGLSGANVPIVGGSSADNTIEGHWYQVANGQVLDNGVVVTALYPSTPVRYAFNNSYQPTEHSGIITRAEGRVIQTINHKPAAEVYNTWTGGLIKEHMDGGNILGLTTLKPLGREANWTRGATLYQLSHPDAVVADRGLSLFTAAERGEKIVLMESTPHDLVYRVDNITSKALMNVKDRESQIVGALIIYCAGCMLTVQDDMQEVSKQFSKELRGKPYLGVFTFGEQGCALLGENKHGNLMMSMVLFEK